MSKRPKRARPGAEINRVCIIGGAGHVGLPLALLIADAGFDVDIVDVNKSALAKIRSGRMPFNEEGGPALLKKVLASGRLHLSSRQTPIRRADVVICVIGTPVDEFLSPKTAAFFRTIADCRPYLRPGQTLILRSTVYPGLSARINRMFRETKAGVHVSYCPERVAQGFSLRESRELPQIISAFDAEGMAAARKVFGSFCKSMIELDPLEAELAKLFCNSYRYIKFAVANQFDILCRDAGVDYRRVHKAVTQDYPRVRDLPGAGFAAGPCLLKDTMQLSAFSGNSFLLGNAAMLVNEAQPEHMVRWLKQRTDLSKACVAILGMTFKADCDDTRDSLSFKLRKLLTLEARKMIQHDPYYRDAQSVSLKQAVQQADVIVIGVPHSPYRGLKVPAGKLVLDVWGCVAE
jgi:UDP-N-acetyl-D-mannosaminuronic acid dehydrogenase